MNLSVRGKVEERERKRNVIYPEREGVGDGKLERRERENSKDYSIDNGNYD